MTLPNVTVHQIFTHNIIIIICHSIYYEIPWIMIYAEPAVVVAGVMISLL